MTISTFLDLSCNMITKLMEKEDAETMVENYLDTLLNEFKSLVVYKMEIPAGERYWLGYNKDICAKRMVLVKELKLDRKSDLLELIFQWDKEMCSEDIRREKSEVWKRCKELIQHYREMRKRKNRSFNSVTNHKRENIMYLTTKNKEGLVSDEPIKCYKVYQKGKEDGVIKSIVLGTEYRVKGRGCD